MTLAVPSAPPPSSSSCSSTYLLLQVAQHICKSIQLVLRAGPRRRQVHVVAGVAICGRGYMGNTRHNGWLVASPQRLLPSEGDAAPGSNRHRSAQGRPAPPALRAAARIAGTPSNSWAGRGAPSGALLSCHSRRWIWSSSASRCLRSTRSSCMLFCGGGGGAAAHAPSTDS